MLGKARVAAGLLWSLPGQQPTTRTNQRHGDPTLANTNPVLICSVQEPCAVSHPAGLTNTHSVLTGDPWTEGRSSVLSQGVQHYCGAMDNLIEKMDNFNLG